MYRVEQSTSIIAVMDRVGQHAIGLLSYLLGRGKRLFIVCDDSEGLPWILQSAQVILLSDYASGRTLVEDLAERLGVPRAGTEMSDPNSFDQWISKRIEKLSDLSSRDFERLVVMLVTQAGMPRLDNDVTESGDFICRAPDNRTRLLVQCKTGHRDNKIGIGAIQNTVRLAASARCDFVMLFATCDFTKAALEFASACAPAVWLFNRSAVEGVLAQYFTSHERKAKPNASAMVEHCLRIATLASSQAEPRNRLNSSWGHLVERGVGKDQGRRTHRLFLSLGGLIPTRPDEHWTREFAGLVQMFESNGLKVSHDAMNLNAGDYCRGVNEIASAVRQCNHVIYFAEHGAESSFPESLERLKVLQAITDELYDVPDGAGRMIIIRSNDLWNKLSLPSLYANSQTVDPTNPNWKLILLATCRSQVRLSAETTKNE